MIVLNGLARENNNSNPKFLGITRFCINSLHFKFIFGNNIGMLGEICKLL